MNWKPFTFDHQPTQLSRLFYILHSFSILTFYLLTNFRSSTFWSKTFLVSLARKTLYYVRVSICVRERKNRRYTNFVYLCITKYWKWGTMFPYGIYASRIEVSMIWVNSIKSLIAVIRYLVICDRSPPVCSVKLLWSFQ